MKEILDISKWNGDIDFTKLKSEVYGVIIRAGYRGYLSSGTIVPDPYAVAYINACIENDIPYGLYFFTQAKNAAEGAEEAEWTMQFVKQFKVQPLLPIFIDSENSSGYPNGRADHISVTDRTDSVIAFCNKIESYHYWAGVYASTSWFTGSGAKLNDVRLGVYAHWVADYRVDKDGNHYCGYKGPMVLWQYTSTAKFNGIAGKVDANIGYTDFVVTTKRLGLNGYPKDSSIPMPDAPEIPNPPDDDTVSPISKTSIRFVIGFASPGDVGFVTSLIDAIGGITYEVVDGFIYTSEVSAGDQKQIIAKCEELDLPIKEYVEVTVIAETTKDFTDTAVEPAPEPIPGGFTEEEVGIITKLIRWLIKLFGVKIE